jgi:hypothetical protein
VQSSVLGLGAVQVPPLQASALVSTVELWQLAGWQTVPFA